MITEIEVKGKRLDSCYCNPFLINLTVNFSSVTGYLLEDEATVVVMLRGKNGLRFSFEHMAPARMLMALLFDPDLRDKDLERDEFTNLLTRRKPKSN